MYPAMAPLPMGKNNKRFRAVMYGGGQKRKIDNIDEFSITWVSVYNQLNCNTPGTVTQYKISVNG